MNANHFTMYSPYQIAQTKSGGGDMETLRKIALALAIIGALNWGVAGLFRFDVVAQLAGGSAEPIARLLYILIGLSGLISLGLLFDEWRHRDSNMVETHAPDSSNI